MEPTDDELPTSSEPEQRLREARRLASEAGELWREERYAEAAPLFERALRTCEELLGPADPSLAAALRNVGNVRFVQERYRKAFKLYRRAAAVYEAADPGHPELPDTLYWQGRSAFGARRYRKAAAAYERAVALLEAAHPDGSPELQSRLADLGHLYYFVGRYREAEPLYLRALEMAERLFGPDHAAVARSARLVAILYKVVEALGKDAEPYFRRAVAIWEKLGDEEQLLESLYRLADFLHDEGRDAEAEPLYRRWLELLAKVGERVDAPDDRESGTRWMKSGYLEYLRGTGRAAEAEALETEWGPYDSYGDTVRSRARRFEAVLGSYDPKLAEALFRLGSHQLYEKEYAEAERQFQRALEIRERALGPEHPDVAECLSGLATVCRLERRYDEAEGLLARALRILEASPEGEALLGGLVEQRALLAAERGDAGRAEALYREALEIYRREGGPESYDVAEALFRFAIFCLNHDRPGEAASLVAEALELADRDVGVADLEKVDYLDLYAHALGELGRNDEAAAAAAESRAICERYEAEDDMS